MKICENCGNEHNGSYGSGRFCSKKCARGFSTKSKRKEINEKISSTMKQKMMNGEGFGFIKPGYKLSSKKECICPYCGDIFDGYEGSKFCSRSCSVSFYNVKRKGRKSSEETKKKISQSVLQNYKDGKQVYGGTTKWYNYKDIKVQGTYELRTCKILDNWKDKGLIKDWEYTNDKVSYIGLDNKKHTYLIDFKIFNLDNTFEYLETKGYQTTTDLLKWKAVRDQGYKLTVWYGENIELQEQK